ncbi:MAG: ABC transporter substrate-binding protein [Actinobacteria bacterium]|nr:ABC transporter substrate-binding protein [Actinomycetota bacterium]
MFVIGLAAVAAGCGSSSSGSSGSETTGGSSTTASSNSETGATALSGCGKGTEPASGPPITLGAIVTDVPGADLTPVTNSTKAYFDCVNEHGGVDGRPIKYIVEHEQLNPQEVSAVASKLINDDNVMGMVGNTSLIDCSVNGATYAKAGLNIIGAAVDSACYELPDFASANLGPTYSAQLSAQYLVEKEKVDSLLAATTQAPGSEALNVGVLGVAEAANIEGSEELIPIPVTDPNGTALSLAEKAGESGGVIMDLAPEEMVKVLQAAEKQALTERTHWGCVNSCAAAALVEALGPGWNGKMVIPDEYPSLEASGPDSDLYREVNAKYNGGESLSTFGQLGFLMGKIYADAIQELPASQLNRTGINKAIGGIEGYKTDMLCEPWSFGKGKYHVSVSSGRLFTPENGKLKEIQGCTKLEPVTPALKATMGAG